MPELPDLEAIRGFLKPRIVDVEVIEAQVLVPLTIRWPGASQFTELLTGNRFLEIARRGKYLLFSLTSGHILAVNPMLAGRLQYCRPSERRRAKTCFILTLANGWQLRYFDQKQMGKVYLVEQDKLEIIPRWSEMGPEALSPEVTLDVFLQRLRRHQGQVKGILVNDTFLAGIGNAYADEILFAASIYPYRRRSSLARQEVESLYGAMHSVLEEASRVVAERLGERPEEEIRDFLQVHGKGGRPCPRCGSTISQITANQRLTNFCRRCQR